MKFIAIAFTMKDQPFEQIAPVLEYLSKATGAQVGMVCLVHGFMPRETVLEKGFSTDVVDKLKELFPLQMNCYNDGPQRDLMASIIKQTKGDVYTIGEVKEGVLEELKLYEQEGLFVANIPLGWTGGAIPQRPLTYGEQAVGLTFNPGGSQEVNNIKRACADTIDVLNDQRQKAKDENNGEKIAQFTLAIREIQGGQMWGVKATTWQY
jgi:hypothetical protein